MLDRHEIWMRSPGTVSGQLQHPGPERRQNSRWFLARRDSLERGGVHGIEVGAHGFERLAVFMATAQNQGGVAHPQAQQESIRKGFGERFLPGGHRTRIPRVDVRDAGGDDDTLGGRQQQRGVRECLPPHSLADPDSRKTHLIEFASGPARVSGRLVIEGGGPDPDLSEVHALGPFWHGPH